MLAYDENAKRRMVGAMEGWVRTPFLLPSQRNNRLSINIIASDDPLKMEYRNLIRFHTATPNRKALGFEAPK